jgi:signal transduction histidine kinase
VSPPGEVPLAPQAGLDQLESLRQRVEHAGVPVRLAITGIVVRLPAGVELTAYRVVQEALTNVLRHAPGAATTVSLHYGPEELLVEVSNEPAPSVPVREGGGGRGLAGLADRVRLYHGELTAGPRLLGGYRVQARIPLSAGSGAPS